MKFDFFFSVPFWITFLAIVIATRLLDRQTSARRCLLLAASALMVLSIPSFTLPNLIYLLILSIVSYLFGNALIRSPLLAGAALRRSIAALGIAAVLGFLMFFKYGFVQAAVLGGAPPGRPSASRMVFMIGVSYFSFKMIHFIVESYRKKIERPSLLVYLTYILLFPSFISGPINRINQFAPQLNDGASRDLKQDLIIGGERIVRGLFKKLVLVQLIHPYVLGNPPRADTALSLGAVVLGLYAYAFYFYFDFSGYTDLAIGTARLLGVQLPENFNVPFLKRNIRELWTNWHMSLTSWLVDYIYWPLVRKLRDVKSLRAHPVLLSNLGMIVTFIACGMWHGETANFLVWGAYHGLGISILTVYQRQKKKVTKPALQRYFRSRTSLVAGIFFTFNFFALGLIFFVLDMKSLAALLRSLLF
jgi:alginate O-acetyltransferase complex protein AlgI